MAYSYQTAVSDGTLDTLAVSIPYFDRSEISVYFDDVPNDYPWSWVGTTEATLAFAPPIPNGVVVQVKRNTDISARRHDFSGGAMFTSESIDENFEQIMRMAQEAKEGGWGEGVDTFKDTLASSTGGTLVGVLYDGETKQLEQVLGEHGTMLDSVQDALDDLHSSAGASKVGYQIAGGVVRDSAEKFGEFVSVKDFGAVGDGVSDDTAAIQSAIDSLIFSGGVVFIPKGVYVVSSAIKTYSNIVILGEGDASQILVSTDIEVFYSDRTTPSTSIFRAEFHDLYIKKTYTGASTKYDIHLQNPNVCKFSNIRIQSGHVDSSYSSTNVGGIFLDKPSGSSASAFMNRIEDCWIQNNSIYMLNITDSSIKGGYVWGHVRQFSIRIGGASSGNIDIIGVNGIIPSKYNGGIWLDGAGINQIRIIGNEWDGNPLLAVGSGIYSPQNTTQVTVSGNTFWGCGKHGIDTYDPVGWTITGNNFWKGNAQDNSYDDIRITGVTFHPNGNTVTGNTHTIDVSRTNKGYAIREVDGGYYPTSNIYSSNGVLGSSGYQNPAILLLGTNVQVGNSGVGTQESVKLLGGGFNLGYNNTIDVATNNIINASGTIDLTVNTDSFFGNPGGFAGVLSVSSTRYNFAQQSTRTIYAVVGYGTTATFTSLATQNGSSGGCSFTLTMTSAGVIRLTDTSGQQVDVRMRFCGTRGLA